MGAKSELQKHPYYVLFHSMKQRCNNKTHKFYKHYGGRGINVCESWSQPNGIGFRNFIADMPDRPNGHSLERKDNSLGYSPENCIWATPREQASNTRRNVKHTLNGVTKTLSEWARTIGLTHTAISNRIAAGYPLEKALTEKRIARIQVINSYVAMNRARTHCTTGRHELTEKNTRLYRGRRNCRMCENEKKRIKRAQKKPLGG